MAQCFSSKFEPQRLGGGKPASSIESEITVAAPRLPRVRPSLIHTMRRGRSVKTEIGGLGTAEFHIKLRLCAALSLLFFWLIQLTALSPPVANSDSTAAVRTPFDLTPGGGEKVVLNVIMQLQQMTGGYVDLIVQSHNTCQDNKCLRALASTLKVEGLQWDKLRIKQLDSPRRGSRPQESYSIWFYMDNLIYPRESSRGSFSIYHCQFPYDFHRIYQSSEERDGLARRLSAYDVVYVNSRYTANWYMQAMDIERRSFFNRIGFAPDFPSIVNFPPPLSIRFAAAVNPLDSVHDSPKIVVIGRIFEGTQSKLHLFAMEAFVELKKQCVCDAELFLLGSVVPGNERYFEKLAHTARAIRGVTLIPNARESEIAATMESSHFVWSITGIGTPAASNPADAEHFGIALVEAMAVGLIPIVSAKGGHLEIVQPLPVELTVETINDLVSRTLQVMKLPVEQMMQLRTSVISRAQQLNTFSQSFQSVFNFVGVQLHPDNVLIWTLIVQRVRMARQNRGASENEHSRRSDETVNAAVYVETRFDLAIRGNILNLRTALGPTWTFQVWYSEQNEIQLRSALVGLNFINFHSLSALEMGSVFDPRLEGSYQTLFKSKQFWLMNGASGHVLTFQSDSWFRSRGFDPKWLEFDYIGAPWCLDGNSVYLPRDKRPTHDDVMLHSTRQIDETIRVGNGGVSIRNVHAMITAIENYGNTSDLQENEDVFAVSALTEAGYNIASKDFSAYFSLECFCADIPVHQTIIAEFMHFVNYLRSGRDLPDLYHRNVFAVHKPIQIISALKQMLGDDEYIAKLFTDIFMQ